MRRIIESLLVEGRREAHEAPLTLFNLSRVPCVTLFDLALDALLIDGHPCQRTDQAQKLDLLGLVAIASEEVPDRDIGGLTT